MTKIAVTDGNSISEILTRFQSLAELVPLRVIRTDADYDKAVTSLNLLLDAGGADERSPLADLVNFLGAVIGEYEDLHKNGKNMQTQNPRIGSSFDDFLRDDEISMR